jgi:hypothetical protein
MGCLKDITCGTRVIVGIRDFVECSKPESGLFINDLPGISIKTAASVTTEQYQTGVKLLQQSILMGTKHVYDEFISELGPYFNFNSIVETRVLDKFNTQIIAPSPVERGITIKRWRSELAKIFIKEVYIAVQNSGAAKLKIIDRCNVTELDIDLDNDCVNVIPVNYLADSEQVQIVFDQTNFAVFNCSYNSIGRHCGSCGGGHHKNSTILGISNGIEDGNCYGVGVYANIRCYEEEVFCSLLQRMYFLIWYRSGIVFLNELINSSRINNITLFGKEQAIELVKQYQAAYDTKYQTIMKNAYEYIKSTKGDCLICNGNRYVETTP